MTPKGQFMRLGLILLIAFSGLCTVFMSVATAVQAWEEHAQAQWPETTARVDRCELTRTSSNAERKFYINCRLTYAVDAEQNTANVYSSNVPAPEIWQYPPNQIASLEKCVDEHPPGTPIVLHYDSTKHTRVALASDYMPPSGGQRTPSNVRLLEFCATSLLALLTMARITRPRRDYEPPLPADLRST